MQKRIKGGQELPEPENVQKTHSKNRNRLAKQTDDSKVNTLKTRVANRTLSVKSSKID